jgi:LysM repeat protein
MEKEQAGEDLGSVEHFAPTQEVSPVEDLSPEDLVDPSQEPPPPNDSGLREGDENLAGPDNPELAFNDDDFDSGPLDFDVEEGDVVREVAQEVTRGIPGAAEAMNAQLASFLNVAKREVGYRAQPGNTPTSKYGKWFGWPNNGRGHYCAAFVSWCGYMSGNAAHVIRSGSVNYILDKYKNRGRVGSTPRVGSLVIFNWDRKGRAEHIGIVVEVGNGYIKTIEGNTTGLEPNSPNGVYLKLRRGPTIAGYCYPSFTDAGTHPPPPVPKPKPPAPAQQVWHTVRKGETLTSISKQYGVSIAALLGRNKGQGPGQGKITNANLIRVNQRIRVR